MPLGSTAPAAALVVSSRVQPAGLTSPIEVIKSNLAIAASRRRSSYVSKLKWRERAEDSRRSRADKKRRNDMNVIHGCVEERCMTSAGIARKSFRIAAEGCRFKKVPQAGLIFICQPPSVKQKAAGVDQKVGGAYPTHCFILGTLFYGRLRPVSRISWRSEASSAAVCGCWVTRFFVSARSVLRSYSSAAAGDLAGSVLPPFLP